MSRADEIERSLTKTFRKNIWKPFIRGVSEYQLIDEGDRVMVCISGGKDSFVLAKCIQMLQRHWQVKFEARFVCMDPGYNDYNLQYIKDNAEMMGIPLEIFNTRIFDIVAAQQTGSPCYLCARMRRGYLYDYAQKLGCNKIALGHHFSDVIETTLLSILYGGEVKTMMPKLHSDNFAGIDLIRPMYYVREDAIINWRNYNDLTFINCACRFTEGCSLINDGTSKRKVVKGLIRTLMKDNNGVEMNIFRSMSNVNLECVLGYKDENGKYSFMDDYINPTIKDIVSENNEQDS